MYYDLHTHTDWSDGTLDPAALVALAAAAGVRVLAVTDHDTVAGLEEAGQAARRLGIDLVPGVEISATWQGLTVHVVGLGIDPAHSGLVAGLAELQEARLVRARRIVAAFKGAGLGDATAVLERAGIVSRVHLADWLVATGHARDHAAAFRRFLARGSVGYTAAQWLALEDAVAVIGAAGGRAVLAHPTRYRLSGGRLKQLVDRFAESGGAALEVVTAGLDVGETGRLARLAARYGLQASVGSDFHKPLPWRLGPGGLPDLPADCTPVWTQWPIRSTVLM